jgi:hypothetical protein
MQEVFWEACLRGKVDLVRELIEDPRVDPAAEDNWAISDAAYRGHARIVQMLLADARVDPSVRRNEPLCRAAREGHADVTRLLLSHHKVDPSANNNYAIIEAARRGHAAVVKLLLTDQRIGARRAIEVAKLKCARIFAAHERWGIESKRHVYARYHPQLVQEYDATLSRCFAMAWVAKQLPTWGDMVEPVAKRLKKGTFL